MNPPRIRLITRADDAGSSLTANTAIYHALRTGIVRNVSVMATCERVAEAAELLAQEPGICVGLHTTLNAEWDDVKWGPVLPPEEVPSLVDGRGDLLPTTRALHERRPRVEEIFAELEAQLARLQGLGLDVRYADAHMGWTWVVEGLTEQFAAWCAVRGLCYHARYEQRLPDPPAAVPTGDPVERLLARLDAALPGQYVLVAHPAYDNAYMRTLGHEGFPGETVAAEREWERLLFTDPRVLEYCRTHGVHPIRYDEAESLRDEGGTG